MSLLPADYLSTQEIEEKVGSALLAWDQVKQEHLQQITDACRRWLK